MRITTIGRGTIAGTLAELWRSAGHDVTTLGRDGGDASDAEVVLLSVPYDAGPAAFDQVTGLGPQVVIDTTNRLGGEAPPSGHASMVDYIKSKVDGPVAKAFNLNFGKLLKQAAATSPRPQNIWVGDDGARSAVERLTRDIGMQPVNGGGPERAVTQEAFAFMLMAIVKDLDQGLLYYRFGAPENL